MADCNANNINISQFSDLPYHLHESILTLSKPAFGMIYNQTAINVLLDKDPPSKLIPTDKICPSCIDDAVNKWSVLKGYPEAPFINRLTHSLIYWMKQGDVMSCPPLHLPPMYLLNEEDFKQKRILRLEQTWDVLKHFPDNWSEWPDSYRLSQVKNLLSQLGLRGTLDLLGFRQTVGSQDIIPPSRQKLIESFTSKHTEVGAEKSSQPKLTVGARAFSKHGHRDLTSSWWGTCTGTEDAKNQIALNIVSKVLDNAAWMNIHTLPHSIYVIEARVLEGYGVRWLSDGSEFRGFLEPMMEDGHEVGWKH